MQNRTLSSLAWLLPLLAAGLVLALTRYQIIDDAFISFRYADNLARHGELVFNLGERVEGITNLLWTLILAAQSKLFGFPMDGTSLYVSFALLLLGTLRLWQIGRRLGCSPATCTVGAILPILSPDFVGASTNGLEAALYSGLLAEIVYRHLQNQWRIASFCCGLLFMTRPEGLVVGILWNALVWLDTQSWKTCWRSAWIFVAIVVAVTIFRIEYYGSPIPNSVIAKSMGLVYILRGWMATLVYCLKFCIQNLFFAVWAVAGWLYVFRRRRALADASIGFYCFVSLSSCSPSRSRRATAATGCPTIGS